VAASVHIHFFLRYKRIVILWAAIELKVEEEEKEKVKVKGKVKVNGKVKVKGKVKGKRDQRDGTCNVPKREMNSFPLSLKADIKAIKGGGAVLLDKIFLIEMFIWA